MTINAIYDGQVLRPEKPLRLKPNTNVKIELKVIDRVEKKSGIFLSTAENLKLKGPSDWSSRLDDYLYNNGKRL